MFLKLRLNGVLFNSEAWQGLNATDIPLIENIDHQVMKTIFNGHYKTQIEFYYLERGTKPLKQRLASRRIIYLQHILGREDGELVKRVFITQRDNPTSGDFVELVKNYLEDI